jgi:hypothetical protein
MAADSSFATSDSDHVLSAGTNAQSQGVTAMISRFKKHGCSALRSMLSVAAGLAVLGFTTAPTQAQTFGRSVTRTYQGNAKPTFEHTFHGNGDQPEAGECGGFGRWDPTQPPTLLWCFDGGSMWISDGPITWRYDDWFNETGEVWYANDSGWHYWGTWDKKGTFPTSPQSETGVQRTLVPIKAGTTASLARDERTSLAA